MITSEANSALEIAPVLSARLSTISSVRPRVFIRLPTMADSRQPMPATRAAIAAPASLPTIATAISRRVISHSSGRSSSPTLVFSPV